MDIILIIICIFIVGISVYYGLRYIIQLWTGCSVSEASLKIQNFINGTPICSLETDINFQNEVWENLRNIIGEKRYNQLVKLSKTAISTPLLFFRENGGIPCFSLSVFCYDDNEQKTIETVVTNITLKYLHLYGYSENIIVNWKKRYDLNMSILEIQYARSEKEQQLLNVILQHHRNAIIANNIDVFDDEDDEELNE